MTQSMMNYDQGDVVLVSWPFTDGQSAKQRPAVVLSCAWYNSQFQRDLVLAAISSSIPAALSRDSLELLSAEQASAGLPKLSIVRAGKLFTIHQGRIRRKLGRLPPSCIAKIIAKVNEVFQP